MAEILNPTNFDPINIVEKTELNADANKAQAVISLENPQGYAVDDFVVVGILGEDGAEIGRVLSVSGDDITLTANLALDHQREEPVTKLRGERVRIYRAANVDGNIPADTAFTALTTLDIEPDQMQTEFSDSTGGSGFWYKKTYLNSVSLVETDLADSEASRGGDFGHYATLDEIRREAGLQYADGLDEGVVSDRRNDAESEVKGAISRRYGLPLAYVPSVVVNATKLIAAGYLLLTAYGSGEEGTNKEGDAKLKIGRMLLDKIVDGDIALLDITDVQIAEILAGLGGYPDDDAPDDEDPKFKITDVY